MLCNHGWEKQQTQRPKGSGLKGSGRQRNPPKEILPRSKGPFQKHMAGQKKKKKIYMHKIEHTNSEQE